MSLIGELSTRVKPGRAARSAAVRGWNFGWRTVSLLASPAFAMLGFDTGPTLTPKGAAIELFLVAAGVPGLGPVHSQPLVWIAHVLFWLPILAWLADRARLLLKRRQS